MVESLRELNACTDACFETFVVGSICKSQRFAKKLCARRPFVSAQVLRGDAKKLWLEECGPVEWIEALEAHPRLGDRRASGTAEGSEQRTVLETMDHAKAVTLATLNQRYEERFGHVFLLCAPGVPAHVVEERIRSRCVTTTCGHRRIRVPPPRVHAFMCEFKHSAYTGRANCTAICS